MSTIDLELTIRAGCGQGYLVEMRCIWPGSDAPIDTSATPAPVQIDPARLQALAPDPAAYGLALGQMLLAAPLPARIFSQARAVAQQRRASLRLRLALAADAAALHALRWETLCDPSEPTAPLLTAGAQVVFSRYLSSVDWQPVPQRPKGPLRALVVLASPPDLPDYGLSPLDLEAERAAAQQSFGPIPATVLGPGQADLDTLITHLHEGYDLLYLLAHGRADTDGETWLYLEGRDGRTEPVLGSELTRRIAGLAVRPWLTVLGSCESAGALLALGPQLAQAGVGAVLAMQDRITVETLRRFLPACLQALRGRRPIDQAVAIAREAVQDRPDFWVPALFMRLRGGQLGVQVPPELGRYLHNHTGFMQDRLASFVGRGEELREIQRRVAELLPSGGYVTITAQAGQGKSSLIAKLVELELREQCGAHGPAGIAELAEQAGPSALAYHFIPFSPGPDHQVGLLRNLMTRLILKYDLPDIYVASDSRAVLRDYFARVLEEVAAKGGREVISIDGLDQLEEDASGVRDLSFLPTKPPAGIVVVLGTRPNDTLQQLELRGPHHRYELPPLSRADFDLILQHRHVALAPDLADRFYTVMEANALYLDLVAHELPQAGALAPEEIIARIADNPDNLFSLAIERLKRPALTWRETIKPILGLLLVALAPLSALSIRALLGQDNDTVQDALVRLGGLLARDGERRYTLFHLKLRDFLREDPRRLGEARVFASDDEEGYHQKLADWCDRPGLACIWQDHGRDRGEQERRTYARQHLIAHLCRAQHWPRLWEVLDQGEYGRAKLQHDPSTRSFVQDLDTVRQALATAAGADTSEGAAWIPRLWRYSLLRCSLSSQADNYPEGLIVLLAQLGRGQEAIGLAEVLTNSKRKAVTLVRIGEVVGQQGRAAERQQLVARAIEIARMTDSQGAELQESALAGVVEALVRAQRLDEAAALAQQIADAGRRVRVLAELALALTQAQRLEQALALTQQIADTGRRAQALAGVAHVLTQAGCLEEAFKVAQEAAAVARQIADAEEQTEALAAVAEVLAQAQRLDEALALTQQIPDPGWRAQALVGVVQALAQAQRLEQASTVAQAAAVAAQHIDDEERRAEVLVGVAGALALAQRVEEALALAQQMPDAGRQAFVMARVVQALALARRAKEALALAQQITDKWRRALVLARVVEALALARRLDEALTLAQQISDPDRHTEALAAVAEALALAQRLDEALALARQIADARRRARVLMGIAEALTQAQRLDEALALARQIADAGRRARVLVGIAEALAQARRLDEAFKVAQEVGAIARDIVDEERRAKALLALVQALTQARRLDEAFKVAQEVGAIARDIVDEERQAKVLADVVRALTQAQRLDEAAALAQQIPDAKGQAEALADVVRALTQAQRLDEAAALAQQITDAKERAEALADVVQALTQAQRLDEAAALAQQITDAGRRAKALAGVVRTLTQAQRLDEALALAQQLPDAGWRAEMLAGVVRALTQAQRLKEALALAQQLPDAGWRAKALVGVVEALTQAHHLEAALALTQQISVAEWRVLALADVVRALTQARRLEEALALAQQLPDAEQRAEVLADVVRALTQARRFEQATALAQQLPGAEQRAEVLADVVRALTQARRLEQALALAQQMPDTTWRSKAIGGVVEALAQDLEEALGPIGQITDAAWQALALAGVVRALTQAQRLEEATALARQIADAAWQALALAGVVRALTQAQRLEEALALAQQIPDPEWRSEVQGDVVRALAQAQRLEEALALAKQITGAERQASVLADVVRALAQAQRLDAACKVARKVVAVAHQISNMRWRAEVLVRTVRALAQAQLLEEASAIAQEIVALARQITNTRWRAEVLMGVIEALAQAQRLEETSKVAREITAMARQITLTGDCRYEEVLLDMVQTLTQVTRWEAVRPIVDKVAGISLDSLSDFISTLPHLPTVLALVRRMWSQAARRDDLYTLLPAAAPLFVADPALLPQILAGEVWVRDQLRS